MMEAAIAYLDRGFVLIPVRPGGKEPEARLLPLGDDGRPSWAALLDDPPTAALVRAWLREEPSLNLGIATGVSSGVAITDFDRLPPPWMPPLLDQLGAPIAASGEG